MKSDKDIREEVFQEMTQSGTLMGKNHDLAEGVSAVDVHDAFIERYAQKMNEELWEPYGKARLNGTSTGAIINRELERFVTLINASCQELFLATLDVKELIERLKGYLDKRYI